MVFDIRFRLWTAGWVLVLCLSPLPAAAQSEPAGDQPPAQAATQSTPKAQEPPPPTETVAAKETAPAAPALEPKSDAPNPTEPKNGAVGLEGTWTKKFVLKSADGAFSFQPTGRVQPLFKLPINADAEEPVEGLGFMFKRARFGFSALMFQQVTLYMDADLAKGSAALVDYYLDYNPLGGKGKLDGVAVLRMGHFRPWFGRQFLMSTAKLQLIEDAQAWKDEAMGLAMQRDLGAGIFGMVLGGIEYGVGLWNGEEWPSKVWNGQDDAKPTQFDTKSPGSVGAGSGADRIPGNFDFMVGGRVAVHPLALAKISEPLPPSGESDEELSPTPRLSVGVSAMYNKRHNQIVNMADPAEDPAFQLYYDSQIKLGADLAFMMLGLSATAELFVLVTDIQSDAPAAVKAAVAANAYEGTGLGTYVQLGYFVLPKRIEIAGRFDLVDEDLDVAGLRLFPGLGVNGYIFGNNLKAQLMYRLNVASGYKANTPAPAAWQENPTSHDIFLMLQASI
ncbi:MAG: hypothetical protein MUC50_19445 [Myxococcota bacterium]|nr:hypothetical protein [Myxococcota bacterium]